MMRTFKHKVRGGRYAAIGVGKAQGKISDNDSVVAYRGLDGYLWVRGQVEFSDGRFVEDEPLVLAGDPIKPTAWAYDLVCSDGIAKDKLSTIPQYEEEGHRINVRALVPLALLESSVEEAAGLRMALESTLEWLETAPLSFESGCCECGDPMDDHSDPMSCGHAPVDSGIRSWAQKVECLKGVLGQKEGDVGK